VNGVHDLGGMQGFGPIEADTYYHHWVAALESLCVTRAEIATAAIDECQHDWQRAYENTPHGQPVERR
jgi:hypothetical protein